MSPLSRSALMATLLLATTAPPTAAQITGVVHDPSGHPVASARIELWGDSVRYTTAQSDSAGHFALQAYPDAHIVLAFALGTDSTFAPLGDLMHPLDLVLEPRPLALPGLTAAPTGMRCPQRDDPAARALWEQVAASYTQPPPRATWKAEVTQMRSGVTTAGDFGSIPLAHNVRAMFGGGWSGTDVPLSEVPFTNDWIRKHGYAQRLTMSSLNGRYVAWHFVMLDGSQSPHLVSKAFGDLQRFALDSTDEAERTILFCSKDHGRPWVRGQLFLNEDKRIVGADWEFVTPEPVEHAGGHAEFLPHTRYLLPQSGEYWRRTPVGRYFQEALQFAPWVMQATTPDSSSREGA